MATESRPLTPHTHHPGLAGRALWNHRHLIAQFVRREVQGRYRGSVLGVLWSFLNPLLQLAVYTFVFGSIFPARWPLATSSRLSDFALVLFCGLLVVNLFAECVSRAPGLIVGQTSYVKKIVFPLEILPVVALGSALFNALVALAIVVAANLLLNGFVSWTVALAPMVFLPVVLLALGTSWLLSSLGVFLRDLPYVIAPLLQVLPFLTPIFYPTEAAPAWAQPILALNPLTPVVEALRQVVLWGVVPDWRRLALSLAVGIIAATLGLSWFLKTKRAFADVV